MFYHCAGLSQGGELILVHSFAAERPSHSLVLLVVRTGEVVLMIRLSVVALVALVVNVESTGVACPPVIMVFDRVRLETPIATLLLLAGGRTVRLDGSGWSCCRSWLVLVDGTLMGSLLGALTCSLAGTTATSSALVPTTSAHRRRGNVLWWGNIGRGGWGGIGVGGRVALLELGGK